MSDKSSYDRCIIYESDDISLVARLRDIGLTLALWGAYFYFVRACWPFAHDLERWAIRGFGDFTRYPNLKILPTLWSYIAFGMEASALYIGWAVYNMLRFRGRQRRKPRAPVIPDDLAQMYGFSTESIAEWQKVSSLIMYHDKHGHLTDVKITR